MKDSLKRGTQCFSGLGLWGLGFWGGLAFPMFPIASGPTRKGNVAKYYRGLNNYLYYFGLPYFDYSIMGSLAKYGNLLVNLIMFKTTNPPAVGALASFPI